MTDLASHLGRVMTRETTLTHVMLYTYYGAASVKGWIRFFLGGGGGARENMCMAIFWTRSETVAGCWAGLG